MSDEPFVSEQTQDLLLKHQHAVLQQQKLDVELIRYRMINDAEDRRREDLKAKAIEVLRQIERSEPRVRRKFGAAVPILEGIDAQLTRGEDVSACDLRELEDLLN